MTTTYYVHSASSTEENEVGVMKRIPVSQQFYEDVKEFQDVHDLNNQHDAVLVLWETTRKELKRYYKNEKIMPFLTVGALIAGLLIGTLVL